MGQEKDQEGHHNDKQGRNPRLRKDRNHIAQSKDSKDNQKRSPHFHQPFPLLPVDIQQDCFHNIYNDFKYS